MALTLACAFATSDQSHEHARIAEDLGYQRAWFYDSPALYPDVWVQLCRAAERTKRISLGPGVLVPHLRHPMTNAAAISTLVSIAGQKRVVVGIGSGFTGRLTMGQRPLKWTYVSEYVRVLRALLRGEEVTWEGGAMRMLHPAGFGAPRPIDVPFVIAAAGPKGVAAAREVGGGVLGAWTPVPGFKWSVVLTMGTVLAEGESPDLLAPSRRRATPRRSGFISRSRTASSRGYLGASSGRQRTAMFRNGPPPRGPRSALDRGQRA